MRWSFVIIGTLAGVALWLWGFGGADHVLRHIVSTQRDVQNAMAFAIRALQAGDTGAYISLWSLCFMYGFVHAAGPGHGKLVITGYGAASKVLASRLAILAFTASLAQAGAAIIVVYGAVIVMDWGRTQVAWLADDIMMPLSYALIAGMGAWLMWRGLRQIRPQVSEIVCVSCGHAHGPSLTQAQDMRNWRDAVMIIGSIAIRPCTGAVFLLILTLRLDLIAAGIIGTFMMGLGTASVTILVAFATVTLRETMLNALAQGIIARSSGWAQLVVGAAVFVLAAQLVMRSI